jgi:hypothetical protein
MNRLTRPLLAIETSDDEDLVLGPLVLPLTENEWLAASNFWVTARMGGYEVIQFRDHVLGADPRRKNGYTEGGAMIRPMGVEMSEMKRKERAGSIPPDAPAKHVATARPARRSKWTETTAAAATYWKVKCLTCGAEWVKASPRNVELCKVGHHGKSHYGHPMDYSVVPMRRVEK